MCDPSPAALGDTGAGGQCMVTQSETRTLTAAQVKQFRIDGCLTGLPAIPAAQAAECCARFENVDPARLVAFDHPWQAQVHLLFTWADEIIRHPTILDTMEGLLGPDLLVESADLFVKEPRSQSFITFHQDSYYWDIEPNEMATAWVALSEATLANGCMRYGARTHLHHKRPHEETPEPHNALSRGQAMKLPKEWPIVDAVLEPGQMSIHHCLLAHASGPNQTDRRRIGLAIRYIPTYVRIVSGPPMTATLVRGQDRYGHFAPALPRPKRDMDAAAIAAQQKALEPHAASNFATA
jgi:ectoine hydroxylase-related dioxygenase (phytanoyl-CoA dioxygenase family)